MEKIRGTVKQMLLTQVQHLLDYSIVVIKILDGHSTLEIRYIDIGI